MYSIYSTTNLGYQNRFVSQKVIEVVKGKIYFPKHNKEIGYYYIFRQSIVYKL